MDHIHAEETELRLQLTIAQREAVEAEQRVRDVERRLAQVRQRPRVLPAA